MEIGIFLPAINPFATPELLAAVAREAEDRGIASIWVGEHVVQFEDRVGIPVRGPRPAAAHARHRDARAVHGPGVPGRPHLARPLGHRHLPVGPAQSRVRRQGGRQPRLAVAGPDRSRRRRGLVGAGVRGRGRALGRVGGHAWTRRSASCRRCGRNPRRSSTGTSTSCRRASCGRNRCSSRTRRSTSAGRATPPSAEPGACGSGVVHVQPAARGPARGARHARRRPGGRRTPAGRSHHHGVPLLQAGSSPGWSSGTPKPGWTRSWRCSSPPRPRRRPPPSTR